MKKTTPPRPFIPSLLLLLFTFFLGMNANSQETKPLTVENVNLTLSYVNFWHNQELRADVDQSLIEITPDIPFDVEGDDWRFILRAKFTPLQFYRITIKPGAVHTPKNQTYAQPFTYSFVAPREAPKHSFATNGTFFPLHAPIWELPLTNIINRGSHLNVQVYSIYPSRLMDFLFTKYNSYKEDNGRQIFADKYPLPPNQDVRVNASLNLEKIGIPRGKPGIYWITTEGYWKDATVVVTDLSPFVVQNRNQLQCVVRRLSDPRKPVADAVVTVLSDKSQVLGTASTDPNGQARITLSQLKDKHDSPSLLLVHDPANNDCSFVHLRYFSRNDFIEAPSAMLFTDRGMCRPGETISISAIMRRSDNAAPVANMPVALKIQNSNGTIHTHTTQTDDLGIVHYDYRLAGDALLTLHTVQLLPAGVNDAAMAYATTHFYVDEFVPDQMKVSLKSQIQGLNYSASGKADYYFGMPVTNPRVRLTTRSHFQNFQPPQQHQDFNFGFGYDDLEATPSPTPIRRMVVGDKDGQFTFNTTIEKYADSPDIYPASPVIINTTAEVLGAAGTRSVVANTTAIHHFVPFYLGSKILETDVNNHSNNRLVVQLLGLTPEGKSHPLQGQTIQWRLSHCTWNYMLLENSGVRRREWVHSRKDLANGSISLDTTEQLALDIPFPGEYSLELCNGDNGQLLQRTTFWYGSGAAKERSNHPNQLHFTYNASEFHPGETAKISFETDFDGTYILFAGSSHRKTIARTGEVKAGINTVEVQIPANLHQGRWHVGITAVGNIGTNRDGSPKDPPYARGVAALPINQQQRKLNVTLEAPQVARPGATGEFTLTLKDSTNAPVAGKVILWGVDQGLLALNNYQHKDPYHFFFDNHNCPFDLMDIYSCLYPMLRVVNGRIGGGAASSKYSAYRSRSLDRRLTEGVMRLGVVTVGSSGKATIKGQFPNFSGRLQVMATAISQHAVGVASTAVILRNPVTIAMMAPPTAAPGDVITLQATLFNHTQSKVESKWQWSVSSPDIELQPAECVALLEKDGSATITATATVKPDAACGKNVTFTLTSAATPQGTFTDSTCTTLRQPRQEYFLTQSQLVAPGQSSTLLQPGEVEIGTPLLAIRQHLQWLNNYPYGCLEQTVAAAFPKLAAISLARLGLVPAFVAEDAQIQIRNAVQRMNTMRAWGQRELFAMWPHQDYSRPWIEGSLFAYMFLFEAQRLGVIQLSQEDTWSMINYLRQFLNEKHHNVNLRAYATYLLAMCDPKHAIEYTKLLPLEDPKFENYSRFLTAMALIRAGKAAAGNKLWQSIAKDDFISAINAIDDKERTPLDTTIRRAGLALWILAELLPEDPALPALATILSHNAGDSELSTHDHAWSALGLVQYAIIQPPEALQEGNYAAKMITHPDGTESAISVATGKPIQLTAPAVVKNTGKAPFIVTCTRRVTDLTTTPSKSGFLVQREILDMDNKPVTSCNRGDLLKIRITISGEECDDIVVTELLPGGLEIEDSRFATRYSRLSKNDELTSKSLRTNLVERRFDRLQWFGDLCEKSGQFTFLVRAVTPGEYALPPTQVESMYTPNRRGTAATAPARFIIRQQ